MAGASECHVYQKGVGAVAAKDTKVEVSSTRNRPYQTMCFGTPWGGRPNGRGALALGAGGPRFKSARPDHLLLCFQFTLPDVVCVGT